MSDQEALGQDYLLGERIGQGPYAVLRRVTRRDGGPPVTATLLRPDLARDPQVRAVLRREEQNLRYLRHSSIVGVEDVVVEPDRLVLITEPADRPDLRRLLADRGGVLSAEEASSVGGQIAAALAAGHAHGIWHLDLRPENVQVAPGRPVHVRVTNFGLAALLIDAGQDWKTLAGADSDKLHRLDSIGGPTGYTAPEVRAGAAPSGAADVYSLGVILVELVTGGLPDPGTVPGIRGTRGELGNGGAQPEPIFGEDERSQIFSVARDCLAVDPAARPSARTVADRLAGTGLQAAEPVAFAVSSPSVAAPPDLPPPVYPAPTHPPATPAPPPTPVPAAGAKRRIPRGPLVTLAAGVVLALVVGALSLNAATDEADRRDTAAAQVQTPVSPAPAVQESSAPEQPPAPPPATAAAPEKFRAAYAGHVKGAGSIAIAVRDGGAIAYLCDGKRLEAWLLGTASGGNLDLSGPGGASLTGSYDKDSAAGSVKVGAKSWALDVPVAKKPSGLYRSTARVRNAQAVAGWIVLAGGDQVGMVNIGGVEAPAPRLDVSSRSATVDGVPMTADPIDGTSENGF